MVVIFWFSYQQMHGDFDPYEVDLIHCKGLNSLGGGRTRALSFSISRGSRLEFQLETRAQLDSSCRYLEPSSTSLLEDRGLIKP